MLVSRRWVTVLLLVLPLCAGDDLPSSRAIPCPPEADIAPCVCSLMNSVDMYMDCSDVSSSDELKEIFSINFPFTNFIRLDINGNNGITELRAGDLGPTTYQQIRITDGALQTIDEKALANSYSTLTLLDLHNNDITSFPFDEIDSFTKLQNLNVDSNNLLIFPDLKSSSLMYVNFGHNPLGEIKATALQELPNLREIDLQSCDLPEVPAGTFTGINTLQRIYLDNNTLSVLPAGVISLSTSSSSVHLSDNSIRNIETGALQGVTGDVWLQSNELTELAEEVWRSLFDANLILYAADNPLTCDCSIAWLVLEAKYLTRLGDDVSCADGELVKELNPAIYITMCS